MKRVHIIASALLLVTCLLNSQPVHAYGAKDSNGTAVKMIVAFYTEYITNLLENKDAANKKLKEQHFVPELTDRLQEMIEASGADPVLRAQDVSEDMLKTLKVKPLDKEGWYKVSYQERPGSSENAIPLKVISKDDRLWIQYIVPENKGQEYGDELIPF